MNWFKNYDADEKNLRSFEKYIEEECEHIVNKTAEPYLITTEQDSFGIVCCFVVCRECFERSEEEEGKREVRCHDCKQRKPMKDCSEWRWYDFYAPQGDEPLIICDKCWNLPTHKERRRQDHADYLDEMRGWPDEKEEDDDQDGYYDDGQD